MMTYIDSNNAICAKYSDSQTVFVKITQIRSGFGRSNAQQQTLIGLGLKRLGASVRKQLSAQVIGMIRRVNHLVSVTCE